MTALPVLDNWVSVVKKNKSSLGASTRGLKAARAPDSRNGRGSTVTGKAIGIHIRAAKRNASICVTRLDPDLSCDDLSVYIEQTLSVRPTVELVKAIGSYASFHLTCECQDPAVFLDPCIWPEGSLVRGWREVRQTSSKAASTGEPHQVVTPVNHRHDNLNVDDVTSVHL